jgi:hypothetical protein
MATGNTNKMKSRLFVGVDGLTAGILTEPAVLGGVLVLPLANR